MKRYIASDFHNGNEVADYDRVMAFLELVDDDADEFLIIGDFEELLWSNMNILTTVSPYRDITEKVRGIAQKKPVKIILGNHDWSLGPFASQLEPAKITSPFAEEGVYFTHGHEFDLTSFFVGTLVDPIYWKTAFPFIAPWAFPVWLATKVWAKAEDTYQWGTVLIGEKVRSYAAEHGYHTVIFGHTHFPVDEVRGGIRIVNDGDLLDSYTYVVQENGTIEIRSVI